MQGDFEQYAGEVRRGLEADQTADFLNAFKALDQFEEQETSWLVPGWIPTGQVSLMAADGGTGKTTLWVNLLAALSSGGSCILDPPGYTRKPSLTIFLTTEDSIRKKLRKKLRLAGADLAKIITPDFTESPELLHELKFGSPQIAKLIRWYRPSLIVFDPVQGFVPPKANMGSRNEMRDCIAPLIALGEETGSSSLLVCHTNKRKAAYGRDRIADSADLWDIARSVMMAGYTEDKGIRYLANEKNNYDQLQETILFSIDSDGLSHKEGTSWKRDREYIIGAEQARSVPVREDCKSFILKAIQEAGGAMPTAALDEKATQAGYSFSAVKRSKRDLRADGSVGFFHTGSNTDRVWHIQMLTDSDGNDFEELPSNTETPFDPPSPSDISKVV